MMRFFKSFLGSTIAAWVLIVMGMSVGGALCPQKNLYPLCVGIGIVPAIIFISWVHGDDRRRTWTSLLLLLVLGVCLVLARTLELSRGYTVAIPLVILVIWQKMSTRTKNGRGAEQSARV